MESESTQTGFIINQSESTQSVPTLIRDHQQQQSSKKKNFLASQT